MRVLTLATEVLGTIARSRPVGVLGCTPEFRDVLRDLGFQRVILFERSRRAHELMTGLRVYQDTVFEDVVWGDWRETLPRWREPLAALLSDLTSGNVPYEDRGLLYEAISGTLTADAVFLDKVLTHTEDLVPLATLAAHYRMAPLNLAEVNRFSCEAFFCSELLRETERVDTDRFYAILEKEWRDAPRLSAFLREASQITPRGCYWYYGRPWHRLRPQYEAHLQIFQESEDDGAGPYAGRLRTLLSRPRQS